MEILLIRLFHYYPHFLLSFLLMKTYGFKEQIKHPKVFFVFSILCLIFWDSLINNFYSVTTFSIVPFTIRILLILGYLFSAQLLSIYGYRGYWHYKYLLISMWWFFYEVDRSILFAGAFFLRKRFSIDFNMAIIGILNHFTLTFVTYGLYLLKINSTISFSKKYSIFMGIISFTAGEFIVTFDSDLTYLDNINTLSREISVWFFLTVIVGVMYVGFSMFLRQLEQVQAEKNLSYLYKLNLDSAQTLYRESRKILHDSKNQITVLSSLINQNNLTDAKSFFKAYLAANEAALSSICSGNTTVDAVLHNEQVKAQTWKIPLEIKAVLPEELSINMAELSAVLFNCIDNALEASRIASNPNVSVTLKKWQNYILLVVSNQVDNNVMLQNPMMKSTKKDSSRHGNGTYIIQQIAEKYDGNVEYSQKNTVFQISVMLKDKEIDK